jgi:hypothetical protein
MNRQSFAWVAVSLGCGCLLCGCPAAGKSKADSGNEIPPIHVKQPPEKLGQGTAPGCDGVTERGLCEGKTAVTCDLESGTQRRVECGALGQKCVVDSTRGARCVKPDPAAGNPSCEAGLDLTGKCVGTTAWFCDPKQGTFSYNCGEDGFVCLDDARSCGYEGAYCCPPKSGSTPASDGGAPPQDAGAGGCKGLDLRGECGGTDHQTLRYCDNNRVVELDCKARNLECVVDRCVAGAFCCPKDAEPGECATVGRSGVCDPDGTLRFCGLDGKVRKVPCADYGYVCSVNTCSAAVADCCDLTCEDLPAEGKCEGPLILLCGSNGEVDYFDCNQTTKKCCCTTSGIPDCCVCPK